MPAHHVKKPTKPPHHTKRHDPPPPPPPAPPPPPPSPSGICSDQHHLTVTLAVEAQQDEVLVSFSYGKNDCATVSSSPVLAYHSPRTSSHYLSAVVLLQLTNCSEDWRLQVRIRSALDLLLMPEMACCFCMLHGVLA